MRRPTRAASSRRTRDASPLTLLGSAGYSLIELLIATAAGAVVLAVATQGLHDLRLRFAHQQETMARQQDLRIGLAVLSAELRLAALGGQLVGRPLLAADSDSLSFLANLSGRSTKLTRRVASREEEVGVVDGSGWPRGKQVFVCDRQRCARGRLARNGTRRALLLRRPLGRAFPPGSQVVLVNHVRYYVSRGKAGRNRLMRMVDRGASTLLEDVTAVGFAYEDRRGRPARRLADIARVRIDVRLEDQSYPLQYVVTL